MRKLLLFIMPVLFGLPLWAQTPCLTMEESMLEAEHDVPYAEGLEEVRAMAEDFEAGRIDVSREDDFKEVVIPVVVHVLYRLEENNISSEQIHTQIEALNRDFNAVNADRDKIPEVWRNLSTSAKFTFKLADRDPDGNWTTGITRKQTDVKNIGTEERYYLPASGGVAPWNQAFYMNIWVCELEGNSLGFAILPSSSMSSRDGIVMAPRAFGTIGTAKAPYNQGRTLVHEVGHYFGLRHLWGDDNESCGATDYIDDTPKQRSENYGCAGYPSVSCSNGPHGDMFMNYMDYSNDTCALLFTKRQVEFMQLIMKRNRRAMFYSTGVTGMEERTNYRWTVYPNPSEGVIHIEFGEDIPEEVVVMNTLGGIVARLSSPRSIERIDLGELPAGVYYLRSHDHHQTLIIR